MSEPTEQTKTVEQRLRDIVTSHLNVNDDQVTREASLTEDLGADSLDLVELVMDVEDAFQQDSLTIEESEAEKVHTFGDLVDLVQRKVSPAE